MSYRDRWDKRENIEIVSITLRQLKIFMALCTGIGIGMGFLFAKMFLI